MLYRPISQEKKADAHGEAVFHAGGDGLGQPGTNAQKGQQGKGQTAQEYGCGHLLPGGHGVISGKQNVGDEGVFAHVRGHRYGTVGVKPHQETAENGHQDRRRRHRSGWDAVIMKDGGIDDDDVGHGDKSGYASQQLNPQGSAVGRRRNSRSNMVTSAPVRMMSLSVPVLYRNGTEVARKKAGGGYHPGNKVDHGAPQIK